MKKIKIILHLLSVICMAGVVITDSIYFSLALLVFSSMLIGVFLGEIDFGKKKNKDNLEDDNGN